jgi:hypothetical protein
MSVKCFLFYEPEKCDNSVRNKQFTVARNVSTRTNISVKKWKVSETVRDMANLFRHIFRMNHFIYHSPMNQVTDPATAFHHSTLVHSHPNSPTAASLLTANTVIHLFELNRDRYDLVRLHG